MRSQILHLITIITYEQNMIIYKKNFRWMNRKRNKWDQIFKNGPSKICGWQPWKNFNYPYHFKFFKGCPSQILLGPFLILEYFVSNGRKFTMNKYFINAIKVIEFNKNLCVHIKLFLIDSSVILLSKDFSDFDIFKGIIERNQE